jgi:tetratricopeptide (TPR) repeat protein/tRNA A-37 threonylcarbamoyl transferase component Bud32
MTQLGPYEVGEELARGGMGVVYRARDPFLDRWLAIKVIRAEELRDAESLERFRREAQVLARLRHPGVVGVHSAGVTPKGYPYLVMDLLEGGSLKGRLSEPLPPGESVRLALQLAEALAYTHERGVFHRDLKPANVLLDEEGQAVLTDFGLAKLVGEERLTRTGDVLGTPSYMAPEQVRGENERIGARTDVYGLGATLFHMLTGRLPFPAKTTTELFPLVLDAPPPAPSLVVAGIDQHLDEICQRCMAKTPKARYPDMRALARELAEWERARAGSGEGAAPWSRRRQRWPWAIAGLVAGVLLGATFGLGLAGPRLVESAPEREWVAAEDLPEDLLRIHDRGASRSEREDFVGAQEDFRAVTRDEPRCDSAWLGLGRACASLDQGDEALKHFARAASLDPHSSSPWHERGVVLHKRADYTGAAEAFREALKRRPDAAPTQLSLAVCLYQLKLEDAGRAALRRSQELDPRMGGNFVLEAQHSEAPLQVRLDLLEKGAKLDPQSEEIFLYRGLLWARAGEHGQATRDYTRALHVLIGPPTLFLLRARSFTRLANFTSATTDLAIALELDPEHHASRLERGKILFMMGRFDLSLKDLKVVARDGGTEYSEPAALLAGRIEAAKERRVYTLTRKVIIRRGPGAEVIGELEGGDPVLLLEIEGVWARVEVKTRTGPLRGHVPANALLLSIKEP